MYAIRSYYGINYISKEYECPVVGGDTNKAPELTLSGTAFGITDNPIYRGGKIGEDICITGDIGRVNCALKILELKKQGDLQNHEFEKIMSEFPEIIKKLAEPRARVKEGLLLNKIITSCCDIVITSYSIHYTKLYDCWKNYSDRNLRQYFR